ncbi:MAG: uracil-DNA glycosylase [Fibrobacterales bacterium]
MKNCEIDLPESWHSKLSAELQKPYIEVLESFVTKERTRQKIYPPREMVCSAFEYTDFDELSVVILGQDPYHGLGQAHGLAFSVQAGVRPPPSLKNIYKEIDRDLGFPQVAHGDLTNWASQGVLLLNTTLTVRESDPKSHAGKGWEVFTDAIISLINEKKEHVVFLLWGSHAHSKEVLIDESKHCILKTTHPSPFSAHRGFLGSNHFSLCNAYLQQHNKKIINWQLPNQSNSLESPMDLFD